MTILIQFSKLVLMHFSFFFTVPLFVGVGCSGPEFFLISSSSRKILSRFFCFVFFRFHFYCCFFHSFAARPWISMEILPVEMSRGLWRRIIFSHPSPVRIHMSHIIQILPLHIEILCDHIPMKDNVLSSIGFCAF